MHQNGGQRISQSRELSTPRQSNKQMASLGSSIAEGVIGVVTGFGPQNNPAKAATKPNTVPAITLVKAAAMSRLLRH